MKAGPRADWTESRTAVTRGTRMAVLQECHLAVAKAVNWVMMADLTADNLVMSMAVMKAGSERWTEETIENCAVGTPLG